MYLIIEGMPSSGKTTLARFLAEKYGAHYYKSVLNDDTFGNQIRKIRDDTTNSIEVDLFHVIDLFRNELQISKKLALGQSVIRDKCFISSFAHCLAVRDEGNQEIKELLLQAYRELKDNMVKPDAVILLDRSIDNSKEIYQNKQDASALDEELLKDNNRFCEQKKHLINLAKEYFGDCLVLITNDESLEQEIEIVERMLKK